MTRSEHLTWAKARSIEYIERGDLAVALSSFASDMNKHAELGVHGAMPLLFMVGGRCVADGDAGGLRHFIEGFN